MPRHHPERHHVHRSPWLRAAVLGANDGIVSTASLLVGVAAAEVSHANVMVAGVAGLVAGAMSMAAGEYVSVSSQADTERADLAREAREQHEFPEYELNELAAVYENRGLTPELARQVAASLMRHDALDAHARDELGISRNLRARPWLAAGTSALTFTVGAALPLLVAWLSIVSRIPLNVAGTSLVFLAGLGALAARTGGARVTIGALRVTFWGALAMALTAWIGTLVGPAV
ncbi:MAG: VIT1/CCC1 transporter family protein [Pseudomonadota bacterium]